MRRRGLSYCIWPCLKWCCQFIPSILFEEHLVTNLEVAGYPCQLVGTRLRPEPIRSTPLPQGPWDEIAVDLCGPLPNGESLLVVIDYFSRWPEVVWMRNTNAQAIIKCMEAMFATHGLPYSVRSDNGPQFVAAELGGFLEYLGIQHTKGIPYWPQSNGEVERFNRTLMKCIKIANVEKTDWSE